MNTECGCSCLFYRYRGFPKVDPKKLDYENPRPYICNFLGSIYPQSSREKLLHIIEEHNLTQYCFIKVRHEYVYFSINLIIFLYIYMFKCFFV